MIYIDASKICLHSTLTSPGSDAVNKDDAAQKDKEAKDATAGKDAATAADRCDVHRGQRKGNRTVLVAIQYCCARILHAHGLRMIACP